MVRKTNLINFSIVAPIVAYLFSYFFLSIMGEYRGVLDVRDEITGSLCLCVDDKMSWQPFKILKANYGISAHSNFLGKIYYPLVSIDQKYWHPNIAFQERGWTAKELEEYKKIVFIKYVARPENKENSKK